MKVDALLLAPNAQWPSLETLAATYGVPVVLAGGGRAVEAIAAEAIDLASHRAQNAFYGSAARAIQAAPVGDGAVLGKAAAIRQALAAGRLHGVVLLLGETGVKQAGFERTLALLEAAVGRRALVCLLGDLAASGEALGAELARRQGSQLSAFAASLAQDGLAPVVSVGPVALLPRIVALLTEIAEGGAPVPTVAACPEFYRAATWAAATSLLALGLPVQIGVRLPFWGSPWLAQALPAEWQRLTGGSLLATPALPDARSQAEGLLVHLSSGRAR
jgi:hypothetical protein